MENPHSTAPIERGEFRLIELLPSAESETIECRLRSYSLDGGHPEYTALSYAWGQNVRDKTISLNGTCFSVGNNLWWFLHHMRLRSQYINFWIDAICIDQSNVMERNHQVQIMRKIYSNAQSVSVWLGKADAFSDSDIAMQWLAGNANLNSLWSLRQAKAVLAFCEMNYWRRMWIIQEIMFAKQVTIYCGSKHIGWSTFEQLVKHLQAISDMGREHHTPCASLILASPAIVIAKAKAAWGGNLQPLTTLLQLYRDHEATNILDKVYALHGLAKDSSDIAVDYGITADALLVKVLRHAYCTLGSRTDMKETIKSLVRFGKLMAEMLNIDCSAKEISLYISMAERESQDDKAEFLQTLHAKSADIIEQAKDDTAASTRPRHNVDYLSQDWKKEDIWSSWRYITSNRDQFGNSARLENASWRNWIKVRNNLRTISPAKLNWLKDYDTTWLYGPLPCAEGSGVTLPKADSDRDKKPILKKNNMLEFMSAHPSKQAQETYEALKHGEDDAASCSSLQRNNQDASSLAASPSPSPEHKHIHFNELVEQCISIDVMGDDEFEDDYDIYDYDSSSSDDGIMMKPIRPKKRVPWYKKASRKPADLEGKIIAKLPPSYLRYRSHTPEIAIDTANRISLGDFFLALRPPPFKHRNSKIA
ncbi:heterokaryon incompatibility domain-containing protein [Trichoderma austrokoningii]